MSRTSWRQSVSAELPTVAGRYQLSRGKQIIHRSGTGIHAWYA